MLRVDKDRLHKLINGEEKKKSNVKMLRGEAITGQRDGGIMGSRKVLNTEVNIFDGPEKDQEEKHEMSKDLNDISTLTKKKKNAHDLQGRLLEKWINDILQDAQDFKLPGFMVSPEHIMPIIRYGLDRQSLTKFKIERSDQDKLYRGIYVHSFGFYQFLRQITGHMSDNREMLIANIWKVYQIVLECACDTDYKMITKKVEESNVNAIKKLTHLNNEIVQRNVEREEKFQKDIAQLVQDQRQFSDARAQLQIDREKMDKQFMVNQQKVEDETVLRMHFQHKLNQLHNVNKKIESQNFVLKEENQKTLKRLNDLQKKFQDMEKQNYEYEYLNKNYEIFKTRLQLDTDLAKKAKEEMTVSFNEMMKLAEFRKEMLVGVQNKLTTAEESIHTMKNQINDLETIKLTSHQKILALERYYKHQLEENEMLKIKIEEQTEQIIDQQKQIVELRTDNEELDADVERHQREIRDLNLELNALKQDNLDLDVKNTSQELLLQNITKENQQFNLKMSEYNDQIQKLTAVKMTLQTKLAIQMNQFSQQDSFHQYLKDAYVTAQKTSMLAAKRCEQIEKILEQNDLRLETTVEQFVIARDDLENTQQTNRQYSLQKEDLQKQLRIESNKNSNLQKYWKEKLKIEQNAKHNQNKLIGNLTNENIMLKSEIKGLKRKNDEYLTGQNYALETKDVLMVENKELRTALAKAEDLNKNAKTIIESRIEKIQHQNHRDKMLLEDQVQCHLQKRLKLESELNQAIVENRYLSKKYIAFILLKGWSEQKRKAFEKQVQTNKEIIKVQEKSIEKQMAELERTGFQKEYAQLQLKKIQNLIDEKDQQIEKLTGQVQTLKDKMIKLNKDFIKISLKSNLMVSQSKMMMKNQPIEKPKCRNVGIDTSLEEIYISESISQHSRSKVIESDYKHYLKNIQTGEIKDYVTGQAVPDGWNIIKKKQKQKNTQNILLKQLQNAIKQSNYAQQNYYQTPKEKNETISKKSKGQADLNSIISQDQVPDSLNENQKQSQSQDMDQQLSQLIKDDQRKNSVQILGTGSNSIESEQKNNKSILLFQSLLKQKNTKLQNDVNVNKSKPNQSSDENLRSNSQKSQANNHAFSFQNDQKKSFEEKIDSISDGDKNQKLMDIDQQKDSKFIEKIKSKPEKVIDDLMEFGEDDGDDDNKVKGFLDLEGQGNKAINTDHLKTPIVQHSSPRNNQEDLLDNIMLNSDHDDDEDEDDDDDDSNEGEEEVVAAGSDEYLRLQYKENDPELTKFNFQNQQDYKFFAYIKTQTKEQILPLITALNQLPQVKVCGHLGMCFNCRNKYLKMGDKLVEVHQQLSPATGDDDAEKNTQDLRKAKSTFMQRSESTPNTLFNNVSLKKLSNRFEKGLAMTSTVSQRPLITTPSLPHMHRSGQNWRAISNKPVNFQEELDKILNHHLPNEQNKDKSQQKDMQKMSSIRPSIQANHEIKASRSSERVMSYDQVQTSYDISQDLWPDHSKQQQDLQHQQMYRSHYQFPTKLNAPPALIQLSSPKSSTYKLVKEHVNKVSRNSMQFPQGAYSQSQNNLKVPIHNSLVLSSKTSNTKQSNDAYTSKVQNKSQSSIYGDAKKPRNQFQAQKSQKMIKSNSIADSRLQLTSIIRRAYQSSENDDMNKLNQRRLTEVIQSNVKSKKQMPIIRKEMKNNYSRAVTPTLNSKKM